MSEFHLPMCSANPWDSSTISFFGILLSILITSLYHSQSPINTQMSPWSSTHARSSLPQRDYIGHPTRIARDAQTSTLTRYTLSPTQTSQPPQRMHLTAIITNAQGHSAFQCWALTTPLTTSSSTGTAGASTLPLGDFSNTVYTIVPPHFDGGLHNAPAKQVVLFLSGVANISLPTSDEYVVVQGGRDGIILALDTDGKGHYTVFPSDEETVAIQAPFRDGVVPAHEVVHEGPCRGRGSP